LWTLLSAGAAFAQAQGGGAAALEQDFWDDQYRGWDGIAFRCEMSHNEVAWMTQLCEQTAGEAGFRASVIGIPFVSCSLCDTYTFVTRALDAGIQYPLELKFWLYAPFGNEAGVARVIVSRYYRSAVEMTPAAGFTPDTIPRSGELIFWDETIAFNFRSTAEAIQMLGPAINAKIVEFYTIFNNARN